MSPADRRRGARPAPAPRRAPLPRGGWGLRAVALALGLGAATAGLSAQDARTVDSGTFEWRQDGRTVGRETFEIRKTGREVNAVGRVTTDSAVSGLRPVQVRLATDTAFVPRVFRLRPSAGKLRTVTAVREQARLRLQVSSEAGDRWKEFLASPELSLVEPGVAHHWLAILRQHRRALEAGGAVEVPAVVPTEAHRGSLTLQRRGTERVEVPGEDRSGVRYSAVLEGSGEFRIWTSEDGRVLRVETPSPGLTAVRLPGP